VEAGDHYINHDLLVALAAGDKEAYGKVFEKHWDQVYGVALRLTKSPETARDLAQDIFLKLWDQRHRLPEIKHFPSFLYSITRNLVHDQLRKKVFRESNRENLMNYFSRADTTAPELLESRELNNLLQQSIDKLPPKLRQVLRMGRLEGLSHEQIAKRLGITSQSSKTYMVRALAALHKEMARHPEITPSLFFLLTMFSFS
jgi:RNA polymerase sigma-70 factor (ECF subfamily)